MLYTFIFAIHHPFIIVSNNSLSYLLCAYELVLLVQLIRAESV
jgi:hypothetical protein